EPVSIVFASELARSVANGQPLDVDLVGAGSRLPCEMRQRAGGRSFEKTSVERELRPVAGAHEMLLAVVECIGAPEVRAGDRERSQRPLVASQEAAERRIAGRVLLAAVSHDESHSGRRIESRRGAFSQIGDWSRELDPNLSLAAVGCMRWKDEYGNRSRHHGGDCREQDADRPADECSARRRSRLGRVVAHRATNYGTELQGCRRRRQTTNTSICPSLTRTGICGRVAGSLLSL